MLISFLSAQVSAQEIISKYESYGKEYFYLNSLRELLYDRDVSFRKNFDCDSVLFEMKNDKGGLDAGCVVEGDFLWISTTMGPNGRLSSAYVCPRLIDNTIVQELVASAFESNELTNGTLYFLGYSDGWFRDQVNRLALIEMEGETLACWSIGRR